MHMIKLRVKTFKPGYKCYIEPVSKAVETEEEAVEFLRLTLNEYKSINSDVLKNTVQLLTSSKETIIEVVLRGGGGYVHQIIRDQI